MENKTNETETLLYQLKVQRDAINQRSSHTSSNTYITQKYCTTHLYTDSK